MQIKPCKHCGATPKVSDVGGNNPYYEITCGCDKGVFIEVARKEEAIECWNILNERGADDGRS